MNIDDERYNFSIKNYTTTRFQISTMANQLAKYESRFSDYSINSVVSLTEEQQGEIISDIQEDIANDITIFALTHKKSSQIDIYLLSLKEDFLNNVNEMKAEYSNREKTPHRRIRFFYEGMEKYLFSLDL
ncbi:MAG: hypothetical protein Q4B28_02395 [bacterium]|nr:hypothetical protein [bacterium]